MPWVFKKVAALGRMCVSPGFAVLAFSCVLIAHSLCAAQLAAMGQNSASVRLSPDQVRMGAFYNGSQMTISGTAPAGSRVLIIIRGEEKDAIYNRKGRVGPIWLNTDKVHITNVPALFLSYSSGVVRSFLDDDIINQHQLDETAIKNRMSCRIHCKCSSLAPSHGTVKRVTCTGVEPGAGDAELLRASYLKLKAAEGTYRSFPGSVQMADAGNGLANYNVGLLWPRKAPPGVYQVEVYALRDRAILARATAPLPVIEVGFPAFMARLARQRPWFYGLIAVLAAVITGFGIDMVAVRLRKPKRRFEPGRIPAPEAQPAERAAADVVHVPEDEHVHH